MHRRHCATPSSAHRRPLTANASARRRYADGYPSPPRAGPRYDSRENRPPAYNSDRPGRYSEPRGGYSRRSASHGEYYDRGPAPRGFPDNRGGAMYDRPPPLRIPYDERGPPQRGRPDVNSRHNPDSRGPNGYDGYDGGGYGGGSFGGGGNADRGNGLGGGRSDVRYDDRRGGPSPGYDTRGRGTPR
eukprot:scaffold7583_cov118-Isochrysis_galbana.AAC.17